MSRPKRPGEARRCLGLATPAANAVVPATFAPASNEYQVAVTGTFTGATDTTVIVTAGGGHSKLATITANTFTATVVVVPGPNTIDVGVARRDGTTDLATRSFTAVLPPLVVLTSPIQCAQLPVPANITFTADALSRGGTIAKVEFSEQGVIVGTATAPPYSFTHTLTQVGSRSLAAVATDSTGQTANSAVTVSCTSPPPTVALTSPTPGSVIRAGAPIAFAANASTTAAGGSIATVEFLINGSVVANDTTAPYSASVNASGSGTQSLSARAIDNLGVSTTSAPVSISVTANASPTVTLDQPTTGQSIAAGSMVNLAATATDSDGSIAKVEFFANDVLIATDTTAPYTATWTATGTGSVTLTARATDNDGATTNSAGVTVNLVSNLPPSVTLTSPANNAIFTAPTSIVLAATASDADGSVAKVEFFAGMQLLATVTAAPYTTTWSNVLPGNYTVIATATDDNGATTSAQAMIAVGGVSVAITSLMSGQAFIAPASFALSATAATSAGTIVSVQLFDGAQSLGTFTNNVTPLAVTLPLTAVAAGMHTYTAKATTSSGGVVTSTPVTISVGAGPTVSVASPGNNSIAIAPALIHLSAIADGAGSAITKVEYFNGNTLIGTATAPPYDFSWPGVAVGTYTLKARVTTGGNLTSDSAPVAITVIAAPILTFDAGQNGRTVNEDFTQLTGTVQAPPNSAISISGISGGAGGIAVITPDGKFFVNELPLAEGANTFTVQVTTQDNQSANQTLTLNRMGSAGFKVSMSSGEGFAPLKVTFKVEDLGPAPLTHPFEVIEFDLNGDGIADYVATSLAAANFTATIPAGIANVRVTIKARDTNQNLVTIYTTDRKVYAFDSLVRYNMVKAVYGDMLARLTAGSIDQAVNLITETTREQFRAFFNSRGTNLAADVAALGQLTSGSVSNGHANLLLTRMEGADKFGYYIYLIRDGDGIWRVDGM